MSRHKTPREKGKISLKKYFQSFQQGDLVAVAQEMSQIFGYSHRLQGRTGKVIAKRGAAYEIEVPDLGKPKRYMLKPIHLNKIMPASL